MEQADGDQHQPDGQSEAGTTEQQASQPPPISAEIHNIEYSQARSENRSEQYWKAEEVKWIRRGVVWSGTISVLVLLAAVASAIFVYGQWITMDDTLRAATEGNRLTLRQIRDSQRPFLHMTSATFRIEPIGRGMILDFTNTGASPAISPLISRCAIMAPPEAPLDECSQASRVDSALTAVGHGEKAAFIYMMPGMQKSDIEALSTWKNDRRYVRGLISYQDSFGETYDQFFCAVVVRLDEVDGGAGFRPCPSDIWRTEGCQYARNGTCTVSEEEGHEKPD